MSNLVKSAFGASVFALSLTTVSEAALMDMGGSSRQCQRGADPRSGLVIRQRLDWLAGTDAARALTFGAWVIRRIRRF